MKKEQFLLNSKKSMKMLRSGLENFGRALLVPVSIIPLLALIGALGYAIQAISLEVGTYKGVTKTVADGIKDLGMIAIVNIDILLAIGLAAGLAREEKISAGLSGLMAIMALYFASNFMINIMHADWLKTPKEYGLTTRFSTTGFNYNAFGGMMGGLIGFLMHKYTYKLKFPKALSFFGGPRFSPIASTIVGWLFGILLTLIWFPISEGLRSVGQGLGTLKSGGAFLYGASNRLLIPFGLHHVVNYFLYYTSVGATWIDPSGTTIEGIYSVAIAKLGARVPITAQSTWIINGTFPTNMFSLPAVAFAMYFAIPKDKRKVGGSIIIAAALSAFLSGVTEPIEFTFMFASPLLYGIHIVFTGLTYMSMYLGNFAQVSTRGSGLITWIVVNLVNFRIIENWWGLFIVGPIMAGIYFGTFYFLILKLNILTPGRDETKEVKLFTKRDAKLKSVLDSKSPIPVLSKDEQQVNLIIEAYGGAENIVILANCASRLRITVKNPLLFDEDKIKLAGAFGIKKIDNQIQSVFGPQVINIATKLKAKIEYDEG